MAPNSKLRERANPADASDPRDPREGGAEVIDLSTRQVLPQVTQRKKGDGLGIAAGVVAVLALGGVTLWSMDNARNANEAAQPQPAPVQPQQAPAQAAAMPQPAVPAEVPMQAPLPAPAPAPVLSAAPGINAAPQSNPYSNPTVVYDVSGASAPVGAPAAAPGEAKGGSANDDFAARVGGVGGSTAAAARSFDPATTVTQGTLIPAVLETAIDTDVPGYVRAIVSTDVRSFDGKTVLVPRSSRLIGQYKSGLTAGQKRAYVIWSRLIRPDGVSVNLGSPAIAFGGETGLPGKVNSHFFERFGSAMLLSVVGGLSTVATGGAGVVIAGGGQSAAAAAVQQGGQVGPTIRVRQGEPIRVFTARDLDFSKVQ